MLRRALSTRYGVASIRTGQFRMRRTRKASGPSPSGQAASLRVITTAPAARRPVDRPAAGDTLYPGGRHLPNRLSAAALSCRKRLRAARGAAPAGAVIVTPRSSAPALALLLALAAACLLASDPDRWTRGATS